MLKTYSAHNKNKELYRYIITIKVYFIYRCSQANIVHLFSNKTKFPIQLISLSFRHRRERSSYIWKQRKTTHVYILFMFVSLGLLKFDALYYMLLISAKYGSKHHFYFTGIFLNVWYVHISQTFHIYYMYRYYYERLFLFFIVI